MASSIVANLIAASALDGSELYYGVQGDADRKVTGAQIKTHVSDSPTLITPTVVTSVTGAAGSNITFAGGAAANDTANGADVSLTAADGGATSGAGGNITAQAGSAIAGDGTGGTSTFNSGNGHGAGNGGDLYFDSGNAGSSGHGGLMGFYGGLGGSSSGNGGGFELKAGAAFQVGTGGLVTIQAGNGGLTSGDGGDIALTPGTVNSGTVGHILLSAVANFADDAAAATGGVPVTGIYRTASVLKIRVS